MGRCHYSNRGWGVLMKKMMYNAQKGVGMMEVLVAMVILSIAILGFVALQVRATAATDETSQSF